MELQMLCRDIKKLRRKRNRTLIEIFLLYYFGTIAGFLVVAFVLRMSGMYAGQ
ncbi:gp101 [Rhodococcus phage ReqiPoco6]|uniref:Gp101 n=1 Tax=Rhodococcus phage ReqiPoco6 TaxID=691964 RepID=D4P7W9_9CAUD|nr:gp101 [Rhodococcus phage ReqiPoco6]ADD81099.1 gp101 [Rhodococcus phage ReqiPoco6]